MSAWVLAAYALLSALTFLVYGIDKSAAQRQAWRVPEANLHLLALLGGWPGATLAQQWLRHKSQKAEFRFVHWLVVLANTTRAGLIALAPRAVQTGGSARQSSCTPVALMGASQRLRSVAWAAASSAEVEPTGS